MLEPVIPDLREVNVGEFLERGFSLWPLDGNLSVVIAHIVSVAAEPRHIPADPAIIFLARSGIDDQQVIVLAKLVDDHVINECPFGIKQGGIMGLPLLKFGSIVHADVLHCRKRAP